MKLSKIGITIIVLSSLAFLIFVVLGYFNFRFPLLDLGMYNRHMWSLARFDFSANPFKGFNLLGDHSHFILFLFIPIYSLFQTPLTLLVIQALGIGLSGLPIYLIAKKYLKNEFPAAIFLVAYYLFYGFATALDFPFHVSTLAVLPLSFALYFLLEKNYKFLLIFLAVLLITKEDLSLLVIMFGLYLIIIQKQYKLGGIIILVSSFWLVFLTKLFLPFIKGEAYNYSRTASFGNGIFEIIPNIFKKPLLFLRTLFQPEKIRVMKYSLFSFAGLPLIGLEIFILLLPIFLGRFISDQPWCYTIGQHYDATAGPILAVAAIIGAERVGSLLSKYLNKNYLISGLSVAVLLCSLFVAYKLRLPTLNIFTKKWYQVSTSEKRSARRASSLVPHDASLAASSSFVNLSGRKEIMIAPVELNKIQPDYIILGKGFDFYPFGSRGGMDIYAAEATQKYGYQKLIDENGIYLLKRVY